MTNAEKLKNARNLLLKLHKTMLDREREIYEGIHGPLNATQFLNVLLEDEDFSWRVFDGSTDCLSRLHSA